LSFGRKYVWKYPGMIHEGERLFAYELEKEKVNKED